MNDDLPGRAAVLRVIVCKRKAILADAIDVRRHVADNTVGVTTDVGLADVIAKNDQDVWFFFRLSGCYQDCRKKEKKTANHETKNSKRRHTDFLQWFSGGGDRGVRQYPGERTGLEVQPFGSDARA